MDRSIVLVGGFTEGKIVKAVSQSGVSALGKEEADTQMILHACSLSKNRDRIVIRTDNNDVLVLLVYCCSRGELADHVYTYAGHSRKECYIPVNQIAEMHVQQSVSVSQLHML